MNSKWAIAALNGEFYALENLPKNEQGRKVGKAASAFSIALLKIASIAKGDGMPYEDALRGIKAACSYHNWLRDREIERQFTRAWKKATPRRPAVRVLALSDLTTSKKQILSNPTKQAARYTVETTDLVACRSRFRTVDPNHAAKGEQLAKDLSELFITGEWKHAETINVTHLENAPQGDIYRLKFKRYSPALLDCVHVAVGNLDGSLWHDYKNGVFEIAVSHI